MRPNVLHVFASHGKGGGSKKWNTEWWGDGNVRRKTETSARASQHVSITAALKPSWSKAELLEVPEKRVGGAGKCQVSAGKCQVTAVAMVVWCKTQPQKRKCKSKKKGKMLENAKFGLETKSALPLQENPPQSSRTKTTNSKVGNLLSLFAMLTWVLALWIPVRRKPAYLEVLTTPYYPRWGVQFRLSLKDQSFCLCFLFFAFAFVFFFCGCVLQEIKTFT